MHKWSRKNSDKNNCPNTVGNDVPSYVIYVLAFWQKRKARLICPAVKIFQVRDATTVSKLVRRCTSKVPAVSLHRSLQSPAIARH